jgi:hypothetical protein
MRRQFVVRAPSSSIYSGISLTSLVDGAVKVVCVVPVPFAGSRSINTGELWGEQQEGSSTPVLGKEHLWWVYSSVWACK